MIASIHPNRGPTRIENVNPLGELPCPKMP